MKNAEGQLNQIDSFQAKSQWNSLKQTYENLGFRVEQIAGVKSLPDMVFSANQSFNYWNKKKQKPGVILSEMRASERAPEVFYFKSWYEKQGYEVEELPRGAGSFEGNGDAIPHFGDPWVWGGYGFRTDKKIYSYLTEMTGLEFVLLELKSEHFYHLDTCFSVLNEKTVAILPEAFSEKSVNLIRDRVSDIIELDKEECLKYFAGNCHCPNGKDVILNSGSKKFIAELMKRNFVPHTVETSEFMKSGGSVFCLKMMCF
jgi:N-dimethylarginine dimethylaminohydrolase